MPFPEDDFDLEIAAIDNALRDVCHKIQTGLYIADAGTNHPGHSLYVSGNYTDSPQRYLDQVRTNFQVDLLMLRHAIDLARKGPPPHLSRDDNDNPIPKPNPVYGK